MKKNYVKPMMESEAFVANEYVAACWTLDCTGVKADGSACTLYKPVKDSADMTYSEGPWLCYDTIDGLEPCTTKINTSEFQIDNREEFWALVKHAVDTNMGFLKFLDILINGGTLTTKEELHPINVISGWDNHPKASI